MDFFNINGGNMNGGNMNGGNFYKNIDSSKYNEKNKNFIGGDNFYKDVSLRDLQDTYSSQFEDICLDKTNISFRKNDDVNDRTPETALNMNYDEYVSCKSLKLTSL
jgi:hypothetical protein